MTCLSKHHFIEISTIFSNFKKRNTFLVISALNDKNWYLLPSNLAKIVNLFWCAHWMIPYFGMESHQKTSSLSHSPIIRVSSEVEYPGMKYGRLLEVSLTLDALRTKSLSLKVFPLKGCSLVTKEHLLQIMSLSASYDILKETDWSWTLAYNTRSFRSILIWMINVTECLWYVKRDLTYCQFIVKLKRH